MITLTDEQREAVERSPHGVEVVDEASQKRYVIVDREVWQRGVDAAAIREGLEQIESGEGLPADEADRLLRNRLGFPPKP